jgi:hypothetical protein
MQKVSLFWFVPAFTFTLYGEYLSLLTIGERGQRLIHHEDPHQFYSVQSISHLLSIPS